jgi:hypothetical protein
MGLRAGEIWAIGGSGNTMDDKDPLYPFRILPRDLTLTAGEGKLTINVKGAERYCYWVRVEYGSFSQRHNRRRAIENWLEDCKIDFECDLDRYYFTNKADLTMLMLKWS